MATCDLAEQLCLERAHEGMVFACIPKTPAVVQTETRNFAQ